TESDPSRGIRGADCFHCHSGTNFTNYQFLNNGLDPDSSRKDEGRSLVTRQESDQGKFIVPSLRNIALTAPYMHDGRFATLEQVIEHYDRGLQAGATLDPNLAKHLQFGGLSLSTADKRALVAFLKTLTSSDLAPK
ncbi:MAG: cytochrome C peroxidase, partial [Verrucomicrobiaceae bacterium]